MGEVERFEALGFGQMLSWMGQGKDNDFGLFELR